MAEDFGKGENKLRLLFYTPWYVPAWSRGGSVVAISANAEALAAQGWDVEVYTTDFEIKERLFEYGKPVNLNGVSVRYYKHSRNFLGIYSRDLEREVLARIDEFDLVIPYGVWTISSIGIYKACKRKKVPYVISAHGDFGEYTWNHNIIRKRCWWIFFARRFSKNAAGLHFNTCFEKTEAGKHNLPDEKFVVPNVVDCSKWSYDAILAAEWRRKLGIGLSTFVLIYAGRMHRGKGLFMLQEVLGELERDWAMIFVGPEEDETGQKLRQIFEEKRLIDRTIFLNTVPHEDLRGIYSASDCFLLPSQHENFAMVIPEAIACGCSAVISPFVGVGEFLKDFESVQICDLYPKKWIQTINQVRLLNRDNRLIFRGKIEKLFGATAVSKLLDHHFKRILENL